MTAITRAVVTVLTLATGTVLATSTASADTKSDCSEARTFLRSSEARRTCSSRYHSARSLFCTSSSGQRLLLSMARSCKARAAATPASTGGGTTDSESNAKKAPEKAVEPAGASSIDNIPACKAYLARLTACPPAKGPVSRQEEANIMKKKWQEKLDKGSRVDLIGGACQIADKTLKC
jgi:hypothetical protein